ncbi:MAG: cation-translocating P-type ATPase [Pseudomonadota bacterium]
MARQDVLRIDGMFCAGCAASVEAVLSRCSGVQRAAVNFAAEAAVLEWAGDDTNLDGAVAKIRDLGYRVSKLGSESEPAEANDPGRDLALRLVVAAFFGMWTMLPSIALYLNASQDPDVLFGLALAAGLFAMPVVVYAGLPFYRMGWRTLRAGVPGMDLMISTGVFGALTLSLASLISGSSEVYFEVAVALITFQLIGRLIDLKVRRRARDAASALVDLAPARMQQITPEGQEKTTDLKHLKAGDRVLVRPGSRLAADGSVSAGSAQVDRSLLTGEARPVNIQPQSAVYAGDLVLDGVLEIELSATAGRRRLDRLASLVRQTLTEKSAWQQRIETLARHFLWFSLALAMTGAIFALASGQSASEAAVRALAVFVIACPCALSLAAPLAAQLAAAQGASAGMIFRDLNAIFSAARPDRVFLDKTGTLTRGEPRVVDVHPQPGVSKSEVLSWAAQAESGSEHPLARAIVAASPAPDLTGTTRVSAGAGVEWLGSEHRVRVGKHDWVNTHPTPETEAPQGDATRVWVSCNGRLLGAIDLKDTDRPDVLAAVRWLSEEGLKPTILSGDSQAAADAAGKRFGLEALGDQSPEDKVAQMKKAQDGGEQVAFVGDGLNDGPGLATADLGIAVFPATDVARSAAAVTLVGRGLEALPDVLRLTRRTQQIIRQNLIWAAFYNLIAVPAALLGAVQPVVAAIAMTLSSVSVLLNAARIRQTSYTQGNES